MQTELAALSAGTISPDTFFLRTRSEWERLAAYLLRRWPVPSAVAQEDVVQELMLAAWTAVHRYDPARGTTLKGFVVYNATDKAKKWVHKQRAAYRRDDGAPSRHALLLRLDDGETMQAAIDSYMEPEPAAQEEAAAIRQALAEGARAAGRFEAAIVASTLEHGFEGTVDQLVRDELFCVVNRCEDRAAVERLVRGIIVRAVGGKA